MKCIANRCMALYPCVGFQTIFHGKAGVPFAALHVSVQMYRYMESMKMRLQCQGRCLQQMGVTGNMTGMQNHFTNVFGR